jgi:protein-disulfide isomerase
MSLRSLLCRLALILVAAIGSAAAAEPFSPEQKAALDKMIHDYIVDHPQVIFETLQSAAQNHSLDLGKQAIAANRESLLSDPTSPVGGNPDGDVTVVEFFDYRCPYCKEVEPSLEKLLAQDGKVRIVYKEFPILGPASLYAARIAIAARAQGKYAAFHHEMINTKGTIDNETVERVAVAAGIDLSKAKEAAKSAEVDQVIRKNYVLAEALQIQGTPAFVIGEELVQGSAEIGILKRLIAAARKSG